MLSAPQTQERIVLLPCLRELLLEELASRESANFLVHDRGVSASMLYVQMEDPFGEDHLTLGPTSVIRCVGSQLYLEPEQDEAALHHEHMWLARGRKFVSMMIEATVDVFFETADGRRGAQFGPFKRIVFVNGCLHAEAESKLLIAILNDDLNAWEVLAHDQPLPVLVVWPQAPAQHSGAPV